MNGEIVVCDDVLYQYEELDEVDLRAIYWLAGTDEDWLSDFEYIPLPENLIQRCDKDGFKIWSGDYPEEGYMEIYPSVKIGESVDDHIVTKIELYRDEKLYNNAWLYKITMKKS